MSKVVALVLGQAGYASSRQRVVLNAAAARAALPDPAFQATTGSRKRVQTCFLRLAELAY